MSDRMSVDYNRPDDPMNTSPDGVYYDNRITPNIDNRIIYRQQLLEELDIDETRTNYCMRVYRHINPRNNKRIYRIGDKIILESRIYTDNPTSESIHRQASESDGESGLIFKAKLRVGNSIRSFVVKTIGNTEGEETQNMIDNKINNMKILSDSVLMKKCPHFPILYSVLYCNKFKEFDNSPKPGSNTPDINNENKRDFPSYIQIYDNNKLISILTETANGNFNMFRSKFFDNSELLENAIAQIYISIMFFYKITGKYYGYASSDNFLYHRITPGGYFHYRIFGKNYFIKNLGYLWVLWNFKVNSLLPLGGSEIKIKHDSLRLDFKNILFTFSIYEPGETNINFDNEYPIQLKNKILDLHNILFRTVIPITRDNINVFLIQLLDKLEEHNIILTNDKLDTKTVRILNEEPYIIKYFTEFNRPFNQIAKDIAILGRFVTKVKERRRRGGGAVKKILKSYK